MRPNPIQALEADDIIVEIYDTHYGKKQRNPVKVLRTENYL